jgi:hypothetical protein
MVMIPMKKAELMKTLNSNHFSKRLAVLKLKQVQIWFPVTLEQAG